MKTQTQINEKSEGIPEESGVPFQDTHLGSRKHKTNILWFTTSLKHRKIQEIAKKNQIQYILSWKLSNLAGSYPLKAIIPSPFLHPNDGESLLA